MSPQCCPHCSADILFTKGDCWLCHRPLPPDLIPSKPPPPIRRVSAFNDKKELDATEFGLILVTVAVLGYLGLFIGVSAPAVFFLFVLIGVAFHFPLIPILRVLIGAALQFPLIPISLILSALAIVATVAYSKERSTLRKIGIVIAVIILVPVAMCIVGGIIFTSAARSIFRW